MNVFEKFRAKTKEQYKAVFEAGYLLPEIANDIFKDYPPDPLAQVLRGLAMMIVNDFGGLMVLGEYGFGVQAAKIARTMFEASVNAAYLRRTPADLQNFIDYYDVAVKRFYTNLQQVSPDDAAKLDKRDVDETLKRYDAIRQRFPDKSTWTQKNLLERSKDADYKPLYLLLYSHLSGFVHSDIRAIMEKSGGPVGVIDPAPSDKWVGESLAIGHHAVLSSINDYNEASGHKYDHQFLKIHEGYQQAWGP